MQELDVWGCRQYEHFGLVDVLDTNVMPVGKSLVDFLGVWPELEALSLALISFSTNSITCQDSTPPRLPVCSQPVATPVVIC